MYFRMTFHPIKTFAELGAEPPHLLSTLGYMLLFRVPVLWAVFALIYLRVCQIQQMLYLWAAGGQRVSNDSLGDLIEYFSKYASEVHDLFINLSLLPELPPLSATWLWMGLFSLFWILGLWMHNVAWDHAALWMLGGTREEQSFTHSCTAIAEAMGSASIGSLLGLVVFLPSVGFFATPVLGLINIYYWGLRGVSLAAYHKCPTWKGIVATVLHPVLVVIFYVLLTIAAVTIAVMVVPPA